MPNTIEKIGEKTIAFSTTLYSFFYLLALSFLSLFFISNYKKDFVKHFIILSYSFSLAKLGYLLLLAVVFGFMFIGLLVALTVKYNIEAQLDTLLVSFIFNYFSVFLTSFFIYSRLQSSPNISSDLTQEHKLTLYSFTTLINAIALCILFSIVSLVGGFFVSSLSFATDLYTFKTLILDKIELHHILSLFAKSVFFTFYTVAFLFYTTKHHTKMQTLLYLFGIFVFEMVLFAYQSIGSL